MERRQSRPGFLVSAIVHTLILMALSSTELSPARRPLPEPTPTPESNRRVFLPPTEVLRQLAAEQAPAPRPVPPPTPPPDAGKSRISVGAPSPLRQKEPLVLRRDEDLTQTRKGRPDAASQPRPQAETIRSAQARASGSDGVIGQDPNALRLPVGPGQYPGGQREPRVASAGPKAPSIASALERRLQHVGDLGAPTGTGQQVGPLFFDPQGADFTRWLEVFKNEVYRNWIMPQPALMGLRGHVEIEFTVERDGRVSAVRLTRPSGVAAFDRAALNALQAGRFLVLPSDFQPQSVTMQVTFFYNEGPQGA